MKNWLLALLCVAVFSTQAQEANKMGLFLKHESPLSITKNLESEGKFVYGTMRVPQRISNPKGRSFKLAVAIFKSRNPATKDPLVLCAGGPGLSYMDDFVPGLVGEIGDLFLEERDVVVVESRGLKYSEPYLHIPEMESLQLSLLDKNLSADESIDLYIEVIEDAYEDFSNMGIDLSAINSEEIAGEIVYVMEKLGYDRFAMFGSSYGTEVVQNVLMYYPDKLTSAVLNGSVDIYRAGYDMHRGMVEALEETFSAIEEDPELSEAYPDLKTRFLKKVAELNKRPDTLKLHYGPTVQDYKVVLNGNRIALWLFHQMYFNTQLPQSLEKISSGNYEEIIANPGLIFPIPEFSTGLSLSVFLSGTYANKPEHWMEGSEYEELIKGASLSMFGPYFYKSAIEAWPVEARKKPVAFKTDVPLLLLGGQMDHLCKPSYARKLASEQENVHLYLFENVVHSPVDSGPCAIMMLKTFFDDPTKAPDNACMQEFKHEYLLPDSSD